MPLGDWRGQTGVDVYPRSSGSDIDAIASADAEPNRLREALRRPKRLS